MSDGNDSRNPTYLRIANELRKRILSGKYPVGSYLPSQTVLADQDFNAARMTVRAAIEVLESEDLVKAIQGRGTLVLERDGVPTTTPAEVDAGEAILTQLEELQAEITGLSDRVARLENQRTQGP
ncbi:GntR family transcriptional regulator [Glycomyces tritici]|uniref:GntR family transcriptional regulator n=1 Tax=Glycomyces tritici TaxID=2665176 RepID=A0ABT7YQC6_9ACTN|nr:GntR family transcriptional regulator [Glycomyces tritici]MDN3240847.1 GntR family transcriptional regulator [Glycomyces tritici]